ncbi:hypothetical protein Poly30_33870 [Planctomycetes bacterium Poly30]|uniref:Uncharacterized protein n=1 Tax=Saltatorellus ferox TaxID=2528018 RepID=A0A518EUW7_9BACT|nr:hypothetical protein Poly30_33870 [Planctomycetes bacterium Poly30]
MEERLRGKDAVDEVVLYLTGNVTVTLACDGSVALEGVPIVHFLLELLGVAECERLDSSWRLMADTETTFVIQWRRTEWGIELRLPGLEKPQLFDRNEFRSAVASFASAVLTAAHREAAVIPSNRHLRAFWKSLDASIAKLEN